MDKQEIKLKINDNQLKGAYANQIAIMHSKYEFVLDFISMFPPEAIVNSRVIINPASLKKIYQAIGHNISMYEEKFGVIEMDENVKDFSKNIN